MPYLYLFFKICDTCQKYASYPVFSVQTLPETFTSTPAGSSAYKPGKLFFKRAFAPICPKIFGCFT